jgi:DNA-binding CsgD family transcriptional regulator
MKNLQIYKILKEPISETNVNRISELIVLRAIRTHCGYDRKYDKLYKGLLSDMFKSKGEEHTFSDAYDLVQDVNIFLLSYLGRQVDEVLYFDKKGFPITICKACYKIIDQYAWSVYRDSKNCMSLIEAMKYETIPDMFYDKEESFENVEKLIESMKLSEAEHQTLMLFFTGLYTNVEIGKLLGVTTNAIFYRRKRLQNKYSQLKI